MASTFESLQESNHVEAQEHDPTSLSLSSSLPISSDDIHESSINSSEEKHEEQIPISESEETDIMPSNINDALLETDTTSMNSINMITADETSIDLPVGATRSSVARILVKPGQIFRVQIDNEFKEVHGKFVGFEQIRIRIDKYESKKFDRFLLIHH